MLYTIYLIIKFSKNKEDKSVNSTEVYILQVVLQFWCNMNRGANITAHNAENILAQKQEFKNPRIMNDAA